MKPKTSPIAQLVVILLGIAFVMFVLIQTKKPHKPAANAHFSSLPVTPAHAFLTPGQSEIVERLQADGVIQVEAKRGRVYIDPSEWRSIDAAGKEKMATLLAAYIWDRDWPAGIEIFDKQSAKRLARFGQLGLQVD